MTDRGQPLRDLELAVAGTGRVGTSLAAWTVERGARIRRVLARSGSSPPSGPTWPGSATPLERFTSAAEDLLLVAVPDHALRRLAADLAARPQAPVVLHTSGSSGAEALAALRARGSAVGSLHPLMAFPEPRPDPGAAAGTFFALDGDPPALELGRRLVAAWDGEAAEVSSEARLLYHLAATLAAGGVVTLLATAAGLARRLELPPAALRGYITLARGALERAAETSDPATAITGPVARADLETFRRELDALDRAEPGAVPLVLALARESLRQMERRDPLPAEHQEFLAELTKLR